MEQKIFVYKNNSIFLNWIISGILYIKDLYDDNDYSKPFEHFVPKKNNPR